MLKIYNTGQVRSLKDGWILCSAVSILDLFVFFQRLNEWDKNALFAFNYGVGFFQNSAVAILGQVLLLLIWGSEWSSFLQLTTVVVDEIALTFLMSGKWSDRGNRNKKDIFKISFSFVQSKKSWNIGFFSLFLLTALVKVKHFKTVFNSD